MEFGRYKQETKWLAEEILESFSEDEITQIYMSLKELGLRDWWKWKEEKKDLIFQYVNATPSQRQKLKKFAKEMPLLAFAGYQHCSSGYELICRTQELQYYIGGSYRGMAAQSGSIFKEIAEHCDHELWPWGGDDPLFGNS